MKKINRVIIALLYSAWAALFSLTAAALNDPTRPPTATTPVPSNTHLQLTAVFIYPDHKVAIINSQPVKIGDRINQYIVTGISLNTVELTDSNHSKEILELTTAVRTVSH